MSLDDKPDVVEMIYDEHAPREAKSVPLLAPLDAFASAAKRLKQAEVEFKAAQAAYVEAVSALSNAVTS